MGRWEGEGGGLFCEGVEGGAARIAWGGPLGFFAWGSACVIPSTHDTEAYFDLTQESIRGLCTTFNNYIVDIGIVRFLSFLSIATPCYPLRLSHDMLQCSTVSSGTTTKYIVR